MLAGATGATGAIIDFGGPIEEKVSGLEGCHVANPDV